MDPVSTEATRRSLPYMPGLDGLRAVAVIGVLLYHADLAWIPGGFLGVEVFFVISGYLITSLLLAEWGQGGGLDLKRFWMRRARRLLPALYALLASTVAIAAVRVAHELAGLRGDVAAALLYVTNWYLIAREESYFEVMGRPSLLKHLWSLAVEEQFYIVWPVLVLVGMRLLRRRGFLAAVLAAIVASTALMAWLYVPGEDPSRVYYGTDTRAAGLLTGSALAFVWVPWSLAPSLSARRRRILDGVAAAGLIAVVYWMVGIDEADPFLYRGGFLLLDFTTIVLIAAVVHPAGRVGRAMGIGPLRWVGLRSYGIYLWHWPVFMLTRPWVDVTLDGLPLLGYRFALTFLLAEVSYRWVEQPMRHGRLSTARGRLGPPWRLPRWDRGYTRATGPVAQLGLLLILALPLAGLTPLAIVRPEAGVLGADAGPTQTEAGPDAARGSSAVIGGGHSFEASASRGRQRPPERVGGIATPGPANATATEAAAARLLGEEAPDRLGGPGGATPPSPAIATAAAAPYGRRATDGAASAAHFDLPDNPVSGRSDDVRWEGRDAAPSGPPPFTSTLRTTFIGDSVMLGAAPALQRVFGPMSIVDADVSRQFMAGIELVRAYRAQGLLGDVVVIHLGNNGNIGSAQFDQMMALLADVPSVYFLTVKVPRRWEGSVNEAVTDGVTRWDNAALIDWRAASYREPHLFMDDGIHLLSPGRDYYAYLILDAIEGARRRRADPASRTR